MKKIIQIWVPFLIIAAVFVLTSEFSSIEKVNLDPASADRAEQRPAQKAPQTRSVTPATASRLAVGQRFVSHAELVEDQQAAGFLPVGTFGKHWPARVTEIVTGKDEIKFVRQNGTPHHYTKFDGYEMKMVRLMTGQQETVVVFRSSAKR